MVNTRREINHASGQIRKDLDAKCPVYATTIRDFAKILDVEIPKENKGRGPGKKKRPMLIGEFHFTDESARRWR